MEIKFKDEEEALYSKLYVSRDDFAFAKYCLGVLLKKGWHHKMLERRGTIFQQQTAFTSALVVAYARPFTKSRGWPQFPSELKDFDLRETALHEHMLEMRHTIYAHSDSKHHTLRPQRIGKYLVHMAGVGVPITAEEAALLKQMIDKLQVAIDQRLTKLLAECESRIN